MSIAYPANAITGRVHLKLENLQPSGSFKSRGVGNFILQQVQAFDGKNAQKSLHFYSPSGGNAGLAAVCAAVALEYPCTVVVPLTTKAIFVDKLKSAGAHDVIQIGESWKETDAHLRNQILPTDPGGIYVPPFDHEDIWDGNATMIDEILEDWFDYLGDAHDRPSPAAIIGSVGGGGLFCGVAQGLFQYPLWAKKVPIVAVETKGADSLAASLHAGEHVTLDAITSQATTLGAKQVCKQAYDIAARQTEDGFGGKGLVKSVVLEDAEAAMACWRLADDFKVLVELSCGVSVAMAYLDGGKRLEAALDRKLNAEDEVIIVLCGGSGVSLDQISQWKQQFGWMFDDGKSDVLKDS
ncbi:MAG: hypothetical protein M1831_007208 [Alyxoria varia]|nr:MAG: hypothetical protein M1831_007208 [Alyxoria varia]